jgi:hypothetical protein
MPDSYHPEAGTKDMLTKVRRVVTGLGDLVDGYEFHYPGEVNEDNVAKIQRALGLDDRFILDSHPKQNRVRSGELMQLHSPFLSRLHWHLSSGLRLVSTPFYFSTIGRIVP